MRHFLPAALLLALPLTAQGQEAQQPLRVMMCEMVDESGSGWVPEFLMFTRQDAGPHQGRIEVFDPILQKLVRRPIEAVVTVDTPLSRTYGWALGGVKNHSGQYTERLDYRLKVSKATGRADLQVKAQEYENVMRGNGRCVSPDG
ncbi:hypothetical protein [Paracoccus aestuariivivens]|uniref:Uncharacterized protein n=1 Tax=Paracoccus aestuariivivens TaxID=1820333 RepID=A0A6L6J8R7_9RHOB|nr:hypothetical protein [Paracoccus aestuariivivens]MTH76524.1 hypothetical protein [Paracoccus aestuariivivens]